MITKYPYDFQNKSPRINYNCNSPCNYIGEEALETKSLFNSNNIFGEEKEEENYFLNIDYLNTFIPYNYKENSNIIINEEDDDKKCIKYSLCDICPISQNFRTAQNSFLEIKPKKPIIFEINYCPKNSLFTKTKVNNFLVEEEKVTNYLKRKRSTNRRKSS